MIPPCEMALPLCWTGKRYDEKVDVFSFGIVLCEVCLTTTCLTPSFFFSSSSPHTVCDPVIILQEFMQNLCRNQTSRSTCVCLREAFRSFSVRLWL